jgi:hypothetical protein
MGHDWREMGHVLQGLDRHATTGFHERTLVAGADRRDAEPPLAVHGRGRRLILAQFHSAVPDLREPVTRE